MVYGLLLSCFAGCSLCVEAAGSPEMVRDGHRCDNIYIVWVVPPPSNSGNEGL